VNDGDHHGDVDAAAGAAISITALPVLSYAMAHSRIGVIDEVTVTGVAADSRGA